ncbi:MAG TPA: putative zinc-binding protein [Methanothrix sp.]|nr:putative zinc-binding protein [Methanothrix sp.]HOK58063.1 putative zinc-binding protein [Methanothrix sp.]HOL43466.1 putative zinc-binding protein [Methanothrix sp.]HPO88516.1 putative zinc-binding protein [Methanothrix sp.]
MAESCLCEARRAIFTCSGGSNVGQLANAAGRELTAQGYGRISCLAGITASIRGITASAQGADAIVSIDGCSLECCRKSLELCGFQPDLCVVITELGVKKSPDLSISEEELRIVVDAIKGQMAGI